MRNTKASDQNTVGGKVAVFRPESPQSIGERMKSVREALNLTQGSLAVAVGGKKRGIQDNEADISAPNSKVILGMVALGVNANWLLTGFGETWLKDLERAPPALNAALLSSALAAVQVEIARARLAPSPEKHAEVVALVYEHCLPSGELQPGVVERYVKLIS